MPYTKEQKENIIISICDKVIEDKISFNKAVKDSEISLVSFYKWISKDEGLESLYNYARIVRSDILFEEIIEISDNTEQGTIVETDDHGRTKEKTGDMTQHRRLKIDSRKWVAAKMQPKKYGDKLDLSSLDGSMTPKTNIVTTLTPDQLKEALNK
jgi:hypothetical protein